MRYKIIIIIIAMFMLNGLNNSREINDLAIVSAIGVNKIDDKNYRVSAIVLNPTKEDGGSSSSSSSSKMTVYEGVDTTIQEAIRKMILESPRRLYLAHMELLLISESVAKEDLTNALDFFIRDNEGSNEFLFVMTKDVEPREVLKIKSPGEEIPSENIVKSIEATAKYMGITTENLLNDSIEYILEEGEELVMPSIRVEEEKSESSSESNEKEQSGSKKEESSNEENKKIIIDTLAYFKDNKLQGYLNEDESRVYNILRNKFKSGVIKVESADRLVAEFIKCDSNIKPKYENGEYVIDIEVKGTCNITEIGEKISDVNYSNIKEYETLIEQKIYTDIQKYIFNCQNIYEADLSGFGKIFREKLNKEYKKIKDNFYTDIFKNIKTNISVDISFPNDGGINKRW